MEPSWVVETKLAAWWPPAGHKPTFIFRLREAEAASKKNSEENTKYGENVWMYFQMQNKVKYVFQCVFS